MFIVDTWNSKVSNLGMSVSGGSFIVPRDTPSSSSITGEMPEVALGTLIEFRRPEFSASLKLLRRLLLLINESECGTKPGEDICAKEVAPDKR